MQTDDFPKRNPCDRVEVIRHTYDQFEVTAYDLFGSVLRHRWFAYGANRKSIAIRYAYLIADRFGLWYDGLVHGYANDERYEIIAGDPEAYGEERDTVRRCAS